jgi:transcriptional regulator with XRE-family HTH domain
MSMPLGNSPAVARRRVRHALRQAREARGLTQQDVADKMDWSLSKVTRIESGEVSVSASDLFVLLQVLGINDEAVVAQLTNDARVSRRQRWLADPRVRDNLTKSTQQLIQFEMEAVSMRHFHTMLVPGILQTPEYANATLNTFRGPLSDTQISVRLQNRMQRQQDLLTREDLPEIFVLLDESVLHREVGGPVVMAGQLDRLLQEMRSGRANIRIVPFARAATIALMGPFIVLEMKDRAGSILYREERLNDEVVHASTEVARHREVFETLWKAALDDEASTQLIAQRAKEMRS